MIDANKNITDQIKPQILIILQNFYGDNYGKLNHYLYTTAIINRKNATYSRIVPYLEPHFKMYFTECTPMVGIEHTEKFPTDHDWLNKALTDREWFATLAFGKQAQDACEFLKYGNAIYLPHPVSFKWRKKLILDTVENLKQNI